MFWWSLFSFSDVGMDGRVAGDASHQGNAAEEVVVSEEVVQGDAMEEEALGEGSEEQQRKRARGGRRGPKPKKWTEAASRALIDAVRVEKERNPTAFRQANTAASFARWPNVVKRMQELGHVGLSKKDCCKKWSDLSTKYRQVRRTVEQTGGIERGEFEDPVTGKVRNTGYRALWDLIELMNPIMHNHPSITLEYVQGTTPLVGKEERGVGLQDSFESSLSR